MTRRSDPLQKPARTLYFGLVLGTVGWMATGAWAQSDPVLNVVDDNVGIGTETPSESLHVQGADGNPRILIEDTSSAIELSSMIVMKSADGQGFTFENTSDGLIWNFLNNQNGRFAINSTAGVGSEFLIDGNNGNVFIKGRVFTGGPTCGAGCDSVLTPGRALPSIEEHAAQMWELGYLPAVGPISSGEPINLTDTTGNILNELEKAHIYIEQLHDALEDKDARLASLEGTVARLQALVEGDGR